MESLITDMGSSITTQMCRVLSQSTAALMHAGLAYRATVRQRWPNRERIDTEIGRWIQIPASDSKIVRVEIKSAIPSCMMGSRMG